MEAANKMQKTFLDIFKRCSCGDWGNYGALKKHVHSPSDIKVDKQNSFRDSKVRWWY